MQVSRAQSFAELRRKTLTTSPNWGVNRYLLMRNNCEHNYSQFIPMPLSLWHCRSPSRAVSATAPNELLHLRLARRAAYRLPAQPPAAPTILGCFVGPMALDPPTAAHGMTPRRRWAEPFWKRRKLRAKPCPLTAHGRKSISMADRVTRQNPQYVLQ